MTLPARDDAAPRHDTPGPMPDAAFRRIAELAHREAGFRIPDTKRGLVQSRIMRRMRALGLQDFTDYARLVGGSGQESAEERRQMISALSTNVTSFFREAHHFELLKSEVLPPLLDAGRRVRIWSAGCSTGQEAFSIALTLLELDDGAARKDIRILATDIDEVVLAAAREAVYPDDQLARLSEAQRTAHFHPVREGHARASAGLRNLVSVRRLNLLGDWPMTGTFDVIFCRNVAIYFDAPTQARLWARFARVMTAGSWLFLGHSERVADPAAAGFRRAGVTAYRRTDDV